MGYTTNFMGSFALDKPLKPEHAAYLHKFAETRRMKRDPEIASTLPDPTRIAAGLPIGEEGAYFVGGRGFAGQDGDPSILDYNGEPRGQESLWNHWVPNEYGTAIEWDGGEKFYAYEQWMRYIVKHFLAPWGYVLNGIVTWQGEEHGDIGTLVMKDNVLTTRMGKHLKRVPA